MLDKYKVLFSHILICTVVCSAIYLAFATTPFIRHDDYFYPTLPMAEDCRSSEAYAGMVGYGRIIQSELTCVLVRASQNVQSAYFFVTLRLIILFAVGIMGGLLSYWIHRVCSTGQTLAILLSILILTLPGYTVYIGNTWFVTIIVAMISVMVAILVLKDENVTGQWRKDFSDWKRMSLSLLFLLLALFNYQALALFYLVPSVAVLIFGYHMTMAQRRNIVFRHLMIFGAGLGVYWILQKGVVGPLYLHMFPSNNFDFGYGEMNVETGVRELYSRFLYTLQKMWSFSFNFWFVQKNPWPAYVVFGTIGGTAILFFLVEGYKAFRDRQFKSRTTQCVLTLALLFLIFLGLQSLQLAYGDFYGYRVTVQLSAMFVLLFVWSIRYMSQLLFRRFFRPIFLAMTFVLALGMSAVAQHQSLHDYAYLTMAEADFLETQIQPLLSKKVSTVFIIRPLGNTKVSGDEHGMLTSCFINDYGLHGMVKYIYRRNALNPDSLRFTAKQRDRHILAVEDVNLIDQGVRDNILVNMDVFLKTLILPR